MSQHRNPGGCFFSSLPRATHPRLSSSISSQHCPPSARAQGKILCFGLLSDSQSIQLSLPGRQKPCCFHSWMLSGCFPALVLCAGEPRWRLGSTLLRANPLATEMSFYNFSCSPWETVSGDSSFPFDSGLFFCLPILGDSFCLFLHSRLMS